MGIRQKILLYFSLSTISVLGLAFFFIYTLFSEYREEEFHQRQKEKITTTLKFLAQNKQTDSEFIESLDRLSINELPEEKLLLFNSKKELIYSSIHDTPVPFSKAILYKLNAGNKWIETNEGNYDIVGTYIEKEGKIHYGISKAYDTFGHSKLSYLKYILLSTYLIITVLIIIVSFYLSKKITQPLLTITERINNYNFEDKYTPITLEDSKNEVVMLGHQFNKLMERMNDAFAFQKHAIHHISHELKTPIAVLVSNFERIEKETDFNTIQLLIKHQKEDTKSLSEIINSLLEIAKAETGNTLLKEKIRIDELIFDVSDELKHVYPDFKFSIEYLHALEEDQLFISGNSRLLKSTFLNLMLNCIRYSSDQKANITISSEPHSIDITFENKGSTISKEENPFLFQHFFRGENSKGKKGFGLGLVLINKIVALHGGKITYSSPEKNSNVFHLSFPLS